MKLLLSLFAGFVVLLLARTAPADDGMHFGRLSGMTVTPSGPGLGIAVSGSYFADHVFQVNALLTLPDQTRTWYIVGGDHGIVLLTDAPPASVWPPSDTLPVLLATVTPVASVEVPNMQLAQSNGTAGPYHWNETFVPILPGSLTVKLDGVAVGQDDGHGRIAGASLAGGAVDYAKGVISVRFNAAPPKGARITTAFTYLPAKVHRSRLTLYPPVDSPKAQARKTAFDRGDYRIPGKDFPAGLPVNVAPGSLTDLAEHPYGCDRAVGEAYRVVSSGHSYRRFRLSDRTMYFPSAAEGAALIATDDNTGHLALKGFPTGVYFDAANLNARLDDGTELGPGSSDCDGRLTTLDVPAGIRFARQSVSVRGGGSRDDAIQQAYLDAGDQIFAIADNTVGAKDRQAMPGRLYLEESTLVWSHPTNLAEGGGRGVSYSGPVIGRNVRIENFGLCITPFHLSDWRDVDLGHCGIGEGEHGNAVAAFGQSDFANFAIDGFLGWSRMRHFRASAPCVDCPGYDGSQTTALLGLQTGGAVGVGVNYDEFADGLLDGGTYPVVINAASTGSRSPIRYIVLHDLWITKRYEFRAQSCGVETGPISFHSGGREEFGPILVWNIFDADTGEVSDELTGSWSSDDKGCAIKSPLPETDFNGNRIDAIRE